jgi:hypothetical protein
MSDKQSKLDNREKDSIKELQQLKVNHWGLSHEYAESIVPLVINESTPEDLERQLDIQLAYQEGMIKMLRLMSER